MTSTTEKSLSSLNPIQRIFVNRSLNFGTIKMIGFDMDHTLAPYRHETFEALAFRETLKKFIEDGYPEELSSLTFNPDFLIRGLLVDRVRGNLLKVDGHKYVKIGYHGHQKLAKEERHQLYNQQSFKAEHFLSIDTLFALSEVQLFVEIVAYMEKHPGSIKKTPLEIYDDLRKFIDLSHRDGSIKERVLRDPEKYIRKDKFLATTLVRLMDAGKKMFLLTNSFYDYTEKVMEFVFDGAHEDLSSWRDYWEFVIVGANKPSFFIGDQKFFEVVEDSHLLKLHDGPLRRSAVYHGGNAKLFERVTGFRGDEILYVGDHIYGDIIRSKGTLNWRTLLILEELEGEIPRLAATKPLLDAIYRRIEDKEAIDEQLQKLRSRIATNQRQYVRAKQRGDQKKMVSLKQDVAKHEEGFAAKMLELKDIEESIRALSAERSKGFHPVWGELMKVGLERSRFADQVSSYACLYTSRVSNLRFYSPYKRFLSFTETLPHELP